MVGGVGLSDRMNEGMGVVVTPFWCGWGWIKMGLVNDKISLISGED